MQLSWVQLWDEFRGPSQFPTAMAVGHRVKCPKYVAVISMFCPPPMMEGVACNK